MNLEGKIDLIKQAVQAIKTAILGKGQTPSGNLSTYADAIDNIVTPNNQNKTVTQNGSVTFDSGYTGLGTVTVNVNQSVQNKTITDNGSYTADSGYVGLGTVTVDVQPDLDTKTITTNGTYNASSDNVDGYSSVTVNVSDDKDMNYWEKTEEDVDGLYHNFYYFDSVYQITLPLDLGIKMLYHQLNPILSSDNIKIANLSALEEINIDYALKDLFKNCTTLISANFNSLNSIQYEMIFQNAFEECTNLQIINFPSLKSNSFGSYTTQFNNMLSGVTGCTVHFPSNLQTVIGSWSSVQNGFGGTNTIVLFDLPATT